jgi:hypothetical protein
VSGYRDPENPRDDPSLLPKLHGKTLIIKDLSPILSMRRQSRAKILSDLRDIYDGFSNHGKGNLGRADYESKFSVLAGTPLAVDRLDAVDQELGERFVKFRIRSHDTASKVRRAIQNVGRDDGMRQEIEKAVLGFFESVNKLSVSLELGNFAEQLAIIADFTAKARSHVPRDRNHNLTYIPRPEVGTRLGKELTKLFLVSAAIRGKRCGEEEELRLVARVAEDCLPPNRLAVLRVLSVAVGPVSVSHVATETRLSWSTANQTLDDLSVLGIVKHVSETAEPDSLWQPEPEWNQVLAQTLMLQSRPVGQSQMTHPRRCQ